MARVLPGSLVCPAPYTGGEACDCHVSPEPGHARSSVFPYDRLALAVARHGDWVLVVCEAAVGWCRADDLRVRA